MNHKLRVYVAGAYSGPDVITILGNMRRGLKLSAEVVECGFAPYVPWADCLLHFLQEFDLKTCYGYSMAWLEVAEAVLVVPEGAEQSHGTQAEIKRAMELGIPVFRTLAELVEWEQNA